MVVVVRLSVGVGNAEPTMVLHATVEQPRLFTAVCRAVCSQADACNGQWLAEVESSGRSKSLLSCSRMWAVNCVRNALHQPC
jgi:hypothetical protein